MGIYHYTVGACLRSILKDRMIQLATAQVPAGERPAVWLTTSPMWEPTANKAMWDARNGRVFRLSKQETAAAGEGLYCIEVLPEAAPYGWDEYKRLSHIPEQAAKSMARTGREMGSQYRDWRVSFTPIAAAQWLRVETEIGSSDQWTELSTDAVLEELEKAAREEQKGKWADPQPVPPWEWRKQK